MSEREERQRARNRAQLAALAPRVIRRLEAVDRLAAEEARINEDGPMTSDPIWHVHGGG